MKTTAFVKTPRIRFKALVRRLFSIMTFYSGLAAFWNAFSARPAVRILTYHGVGTPPRSPFDVTVEDFEEQVSYLKNNFNVITLKDYLEWKKGLKELPEKSVILTFDDGYRNLVENAVPILSKHDVPATFFIVANKLDENDNRYMNEKDVTDASRNPLIDIGSHSQNHRSLGQLSESDAELEAVTSKEKLEACVSRNVDLFAYPYGTFNDFNDRACVTLADAGYELGCTSVNGINVKSTNPYKLRRNKGEWSDDIGTFSRLLQGALDPWFLVDYFLRFLQRPRAVKYN